MSGVFLLFLRGLLIIVLYAFLLLLIVTTWKSLQLNPNSNPPEISFIDSNSRKTYQFRSKYIRLGSDNANELCIELPTVLPFHANVFFRKNFWWIENVDAKAILLVNGAEISSIYRIKEGDEISLGDFILIVKL